jgi:hypothetical protein
LIAHPSSLLLDSLYPSITSTYSSIFLKSVPSGPIIRENHKTKGIRGLERNASSLN